MADDRVITLRFQEWKAMDMALYERLEDGKKELGLSMPAYVKGILRQHFEDGEKAGVGVDACMERIREIVQGELVFQSAVFTRTIERLAEGFPESIKRAGETGGLPESREILPEYSDDFPEGFESVLEKFM